MNLRPVAAKNVPPENAPGRKLGGEIKSFESLNFAFLIKSIEQAR